MHACGQAGTRTEAHTGREARRKRAAADYPPHPTTPLCWEEPAHSVSLSLSLSLSLCTHSPLSLPLTHTRTDTQSLTHRHSRARSLTRSGLHRKFLSVLRSSPITQQPAQDARLGGLAIGPALRITFLTGRHTHTSHCPVPSLFFLFFFGLFFFPGLFFPLR